MWRNLVVDEEFWGGVQGVLSSGAAKYDHEVKMIVPRDAQMAFNANWCFFGNSNPSQDCYLWHNIMFDHFKFVPEFCRLRCYKVVVSIRTVAELIKFHTFMHALPAALQQITPIHGKCGIDTRDYTDNPYDAFIYCDGVEDGRMRYQIMRDAVDTYFDDGKNIKIILKRSCTEFEKEKGPTDNAFWNSYTAEDRNCENSLTDIFQAFKRYAIQPDWHKNYIHLRWIKHANMFGDKSWVDHYGSDFLTMKAVTYHDIPKEGGDKAKRAVRKPKPKRKRNAKGQFI